MTATTPAKPASAQGTVAGWKFVPVEPTQPMLEAAARYADYCAVHNYGGAPDAEGTWDAMISAVAEVTRGPPGEVRAGIRAIIDDALNSAIPEPWEVAEHATDRILSILASEATAAKPRNQKAEDLIRRIEPHIDAIVCYASTMGEHEPNRIAHEVRAFVATANSKAGDEDVRGVPALSEIPASVVVAMSRRLGIVEPFNDLKDDDIAAMFRDGLRAFLDGRARTLATPETESCDAR